MEVLDLSKPVKGREEVTQQGENEEGESSLASLEVLDLSQPVPMRAYVTKMGVNEEGESILTGMDVHDLSKPAELSAFVSQLGENDEGKLTFITEMVTNDDSDVELGAEEEEDYYPVLPTRRNMEEEEEVEEEEESEEEGDGQWKEGVSRPEELAFTGLHGLQVEMKEDATPLDYLRLMIDEHMMENIVTETNRYAAATLASKQLGPSSRFHRWVEVTVQEMWAFFGLIIAMGLTVIDDLDDYWSRDPVFDLPLFRSVMKRDRFCLILSFLHLCDNRDQLPKQHADHDPLFKVRRFISRLTDNFQQVYQPGKKIAIGEAMVAWRGPIAFRVYNPNKPDKLGIKVYELCDSATGYCSTLEVYTGKREVSSSGATFDVVNRLITPYLGCGRVLFVDSYYTSPDLFTYLKKENTFACGTMRPKQKNGPPKAMIPKLSKSYTATASLTNGSLNLLRFFDKREVNMLTTAHDDARVATGRANPVTKEPVIKLAAVHDYNKNMGAVDRSDQMVSYNAFKRRTLKWWKKVFFHMFMLGTLNAYIVHKATAAKRFSHKVFRRELAKELVALVPPLPMGSYSGLGDSSLLRLSARHFLKPILPKEGSKSKYPQRDCIVCSEPGKRRHSRFECRSCNVGLHMECFEIYHTCKDYKRADKRRFEEVE